MLSRHPGARWGGRRMHRKCLPVREGFQEGVTHVERVYLGRGGVLKEESSRHWDEHSAQESMAG